MCTVSPFCEKYGFVVRCNMCGICVTREPPHFSHVMIHWRCKKASFTEESSEASWIKCVASHLPNHFSISCIQPEHKIYLLDLFACFPCNSRMSMWGKQDSPSQCVSEIGNTCIPKLQIILRKQNGHKLKITDTFYICKIHQDYVLRKMGDNFTLNL